MVPPFQYSLLNFRYWSQTHLQGGEPGPAENLVIEHLQPLAVCADQTLFTSIIDVDSVPFELTLRIGYTRFSVHVLHAIRDSDRLAVALRWGLKSFLLEYYFAG